MEPSEPIKPTELDKANIETKRKDPYDGIFFEIDVLLESAKSGCIERLRPLTIRELGKDELFTCIEVYNYDNFRLNYNIFSKSDNGVFGKFEKQSGNTTAIPGLEEHILSHTREKIPSRKQDRAFDEKMNKRLISFFSYCWKQAGGIQAKTPTYFSFERNKKFFNLLDGTTLTKNEILKRIGYTPPRGKITKSPVATVAVGQILENTEFKPLERKDFPEDHSLETIEKSPFMITRDASVKILNTFSYMSNEVKAFIRELTQRFEEEQRLGQEGITAQEEREGRIIVGLKIGEILYLSNEHKAEGKQALLDAATEAAQPLRVHYLMEHFHAVMAGVEELQPGRR